MTERRRFTRRRILQTTLSMGSLAAAGPLNRAFAALPDTPMQTMGPFYPITRPLDTDADLTSLPGHEARAHGTIVQLSGRVLDTSGKPVRNARIELWQANAHGRYAHPADVNQAPLDPNFQGYAVQTTDDEGQYRFKTIKPAAYSIGPMNPDVVRPPHIHFDVQGAHTRLVTQMYFPGERENDEDIIFKQLSAVERQAATATILPDAGGAEPGSIALRWDIVLLAG